MNVKIDIDIAENILKAYARRNRDQIRVYGILLGTIEGKDTIRVQNCVYGFIYESKETDAGDQSESRVQFKRLNDTILNSVLNSYKTNFPNHVILGGFSTDKELFSELFYLFGTINEIESKVFSNKNKILMLVDPWHKNEKVLDYGIKVFNWKYDETQKVISYNKINHELSDFNVTGAALHSNNLNKEEFLLNLNSCAKIEGATIKEILEELIKSVDEEMKISKVNTSESYNTSSLYNVKKQILLTEWFLRVIENYLSGLTGDSFNNEVLFGIDYVLHSIVSYFDREDVLRVVEKEFKDNQIIDSLTNLLSVQVKITEKINKFNV